MFAFALYDATAQTLLLARDPRRREAALLPPCRPRLCVRLRAEGAARRSGAAARVDPERARSLSRLRLRPGRLCILRGRAQAAAGARADASTCDTARSKVVALLGLPPSPRHGAASTTKRWSTSSRRCCVDAVRRQLVADVPVGILLSGGVDSSLVTAHGRARVVAAGQDVHDRFSRPWQLRRGAATRGSSRSTSAPSTSSWRRRRRHGRSAAELARQYDEPIADSSMVPTYLVVAADPSAKPRSRWAATAATSCSAATATTAGSSGRTRSGGGSRGCAARWARRRRGCRPVGAGGII